MARYLGTSGAFVSPDPLMEKYPSVSPYSYCNGNPVKFVDPDGGRPRIYIQLKELGHAFVTTGEGKNTTVYTYGRYGALYPVSFDKTSGSVTPTGEGVLRVKQNATAKEYLETVLRKGNFVIFEINVGSDEATDAYYKSLFDKGWRPSNPAAESYYSEDARVIDDYKLWSNNCVVKSIEGINAQCKVIGSEIVPRFLAARLLIKAMVKESIVFVHNADDFLEELIGTLDDNTGDF